MRTKLAPVGAVAVLAAAAAVAPPAAAAGAAPTPAFTNTPLISILQLPGITTAPNADSTGNSEPAITFGKDGSMAVDGLAWLPFQVNLWKGSFGATPAYFGAMDTDLNVSFNRNVQGVQLGVNVTRCPAGTAAPAGCTHIFIDTAGADRPWITTAGTSAWLTYHDAGNSSLIRVKRSADDGQTWSAAGS